jgi:hypothetical protein
VCAPSNLQFLSPAQNVEISAAHQAAEIYCRAVSFTQNTNCGASSIASTCELRVMGWATFSPRTDAGPRAPFLLLYKNAFRVFLELHIGSACTAWKWKCDTQRRDAPRRRCVSLSLSRRLPLLVFFCLIST